MDIHDDTKTPATVKEMLIDLNGKFDVLNTELRYDREAAAASSLRVYRELDEARRDREAIKASSRQEHEAMKADIREVRDRKTVTPKELWTTVLGALAGVSAIAGIVFGVIGAVNV